MALALRETRRYARQLALAPVGPAGQERLAAARVVVFVGPEGDGAAATAALYLRAAGVGAVEVTPRPSGAAAWAEAVRGASVALRFALDDDPLLATTIEAGVPLIVGRVRGDGIELLSFRRHRPCGHRASDPVTSAVETAARAGDDDDAGAARTVAATLAAAEALMLIVAPTRTPGARLLRLPLDGGAPASADLPWPPPCPVCAPPPENPR